MERKDARNEKQHDTRWLFSRADVLNSPSRKAVDRPLTVEDECRARYSCQELMGHLAGKCSIKNEIVATASVYMHRFYQFFPVNGSYSWQDMAVVCLFLAAKYEDSPRKLEYILKFWNSYTKASVSAVGSENARHLPDLKVEDDKMREKVEELLVLENVLLLTLGFDMHAQHAEFDITQTYPQLRLTKDTALTAYKLAQRWTRFTPLSLLHRPEAIAAACIYYICLKTKTPLLDEDFRGEFHDSFGNRTVMEPSSAHAVHAPTVPTTHVPPTAVSMLTSSSSSAVGNDSSAGATDKGEGKLDWLNCFNESVRKFSPETRRPAPVPVTKQVVQNCIEELKFWASKMPADVKRRLLADDLSSTKQQQQSLSFPTSSSSLAAADSTALRKYHTALLTSSSAAATASSVKQDPVAIAAPVPPTIVVSHTSPARMGVDSPAPPPQTVILQPCDTPKQVENSRPGEPASNDNWVV